MTRTFLVAVGCACGLGVTADLLVRIEASAHQTPRAGTAVIAGVVLEGDSPAPLPFAYVAIATGGPGGTRWIYADANGQFQLDRVAAGSYYLAASRPAYVPAYYGASAPGLPGPPLVIADGQRVEGVTLRPIRGGVITGRVLDEYGDPAVRVEVGALPAGPSGRMNRPVYMPWPSNMYSTDGRGVYRLYGLPPGDYFVVIKPYNSSPLRATGDRPRIGWLPAFHPNVTDADQAVPISLASGEERTDVDFTLRTAPLPDIEGVVVSAGDPTETSPTLRLRLARPELSDSTPYVSPTWTPDGRFVLPGVTPGDYWLTASVAARPPPDQGPRAPAQWLWAIAPVSVRERDVKGVTLTLQPAMHVSGRVILSPEAAADVDGARVHVSLAPLPGTPAVLDASLSAVVDQTGRFMAPAAAGRYQVRVRSSAPAAREFVVTSVILAGQQLPDGTIEVVAGVNLADLIVQVRIR